MSLTSQPLFGGSNNVPITPMTPAEIEKCFGIDRKRLARLVAAGIIRGPIRGPGVETYNVGDLHFRRGRLCGGFGE